MEELFRLRTYIEQNHKAEALILIGEMEEMGRDGKICKILNYTDVLLHYLIVKYAERRLTRSGEATARNAVDMILRVNRRRESGSFYLDKTALEEVIRESWKMALRKASFDAFEGRYDETELGEKVDASQIQKEALQMILAGMGQTE